MHRQHGRTGGSESGLCLLIASRAKPLGFAPSLPVEDQDPVVVRVGDEELVAPNHDASG